MANDFIHSLGTGGRRGLVKQVQSNVNQAFASDAAYKEGTVVKFDTGGTGVTAITAATDAPIGTVVASATNPDGTFTVTVKSVFSAILAGIATEAITIGAAVSPAAWNSTEELMDFSLTPDAGMAYGIALTAASADGDSIQVGVYATPYKSVSATDAVGTVKFTSEATAPTGYVLADDSTEHVNNSYPALLAKWVDETGLLSKDTGTAFTATNATNLLTSAAHGLQDGDIITLSNSGGALPAGLSATVMYYVVSAETDTFQVSLTLGGDAVAFTTDGTGTHSFHEKFILTVDSIDSDLTAIVKY